MMKKLLIIAVLLISNLHTHAQSTFKKNTITSEIGIWQRGLLGISYHRNIELNEFLSTSVGCSGGIGAGIESGGFLFNIKRNVYLGFDANVNIGKRNLMFMLGAEAKYLDVFYNNRYQGFGTLPYAGICFNHNSFTFQIRGGALIWGENLQKTMPSVGLSFGYSF